MTKKSFVLIQQAHLPFFCMVWHDSFCLSYRKILSKSTEKELRLIVVASVKENGEIIGARKVYFDKFLYIIF